LILIAIGATVFFYTYPYYQQYSSTVGKEIELGNTVTFLIGSIIVALIGVYLAGGNYIRDKLKIVFSIGFLIFMLGVGIFLLTQSKVQEGLSLGVLGWSSFLILLILLGGNSSPGIKTSASRWENWGTWIWLTVNIFFTLISFVGGYFVYLNANDYVGFFLFIIAGNFISIFTGLNFKKISLSTLFSLLPLLIILFVIPGESYIEMSRIVILSSPLTLIFWYFFGLNSLFKLLIWFINIEVTSKYARFVVGAIWTFASSIIGMLCAVLSIVLMWIGGAIGVAAIGSGFGMRAPPGFAWISTGTQNSAFGYGIGALFMILLIVVGFFSGIGIYSRFSDLAEKVTIRSINTDYPARIGFVVGSIVFLYLLIGSIIGLLSLR